MQDIVLLVLLSAAVGIALGLAMRCLRLARERNVSDEVGLTWHRRFDAERVEREALELLIRHYGPAILDAQRRWPFHIAPEMRALIGYPTSEEVSKWLVENAAGDRRLSDGMRASWWSSAIPEFTGWRPPQLVAARNGEEG